VKSTASKAGASIQAWRPSAAYLRADILAARAVRVALEDLLGASRCRAELEALVGGEVRVRILSVLRGAPPVPLEGGVAVDVVAQAGQNAVIEVEPDLALALNSRALKRPTPKASANPSVSDCAALAGGVAALIRAVSRFSPGGPISVRSAGPSGQVIASRHPGAPVVDSAVVRVTLDGAGFAARVLLDWAIEAATPGWSRDRLAGLGNTPLTVPIVASPLFVTAHEVSSLGVGDALLIGPAGSTGMLRGDVVLASPFAERGAKAEFVADGTLVLRAGSSEFREGRMTEDSEAIVEAVGDVPVVVRVEVGTATMTAREWAALAPGDVVAMAQRVGGPAILRIGGVEVARGELVEIEGELGVRILSLSGVQRAP
jgi:type III secretion system YscQ/HrcQ family protein